MNGQKPKPREWWIKPGEFSSKIGSEEEILDDDYNLISGDNATWSDDFYPCVTEYRFKNGIHVREVIPEREGGRVTPTIQSKLEALAEEHGDKYTKKRDELWWMRISDFKAGAAALEKLLLEDAGEFSSEQVAKEKANAGPHYGHAFSEGARWQFDQMKAREAVLKAEIEQLKHRFEEIKWPLDREYFMDVMQERDDAEESIHKKDALIKELVYFVAWCAPLGIYDPAHEPTKKVIGEYANAVLAKAKEMGF